MLCTSITNNKSLKFTFLGEGKSHCFPHGSNNLELTSIDDIFLRISKWNSNNTENWFCLKRGFFFESFVERCDF